MGDTSEQGRPTPVLWLLVVLWILGLIGERLSWGCCTPQERGQLNPGGRGGLAPMVLHRGLAGGRCVPTLLLRSG